MNENPLEQQNSKINAVRDEMRGNLGNFFDDKEKNFEDSINNLILKLELLQKNGVIFNKEEIIKGLNESENIKDRELFISFLLKLLEPIILIQATNSKLMDKISRDNILKEEEFLMLSEVLYYDLNNEKVALIHLLPARDLITRDNLEDFNQDIINGLKNLAIIVGHHKEIEKVVATSWIIAKSPERIKKLGFTIIGEISQEEKEKYFKNEKRPIAEAFITRDDFLNIYSDSKNSNQG